MRNPNYWRASIRELFWLLMNEIQHYYIGKYGKFFSKKAFRAVCDKRMALDRYIVAEYEKIGS